MRDSFDMETSEKAMAKNASAIHDQVNNYFRWNLELFHMEKGKRILDIGCGPGLYCSEIMRYEPSLYVAADYSESYLETVRGLLGSRPNYVTRRLDLLDEKSVDSFGEYEFDYILCFDVMEHIEDDAKALRNIHRLIKKTGNGALLFRVPALQIIYGANDKSIGHYRRYHMKQLTRLLESCSFKVELIRYQNIVGVLPWYFIGRVLKRSLAVNPKEGKAFDMIVPAVKLFESLIPPPFGLSLYCKCVAV